MNVISIWSTFRRSIRYVHKHKTSKNCNVSFKKNSLINKCTKERWLYKWNIHFKKEKTAVFFPNSKETRQFISSQDLKAYVKRLTLFKQHNNVKEWVVNTKVTNLLAKVIVRIHRSEAWSCLCSGHRSTSGIYWR